MTDRRPSSHARLRLVCAAVALAALVTTTTGSAQDFRPPWPKDFDQVDVHLLTVGRSSSIFALFGHTILRVIDRSSNVDMSFNWGMFDFRQPNFVWTYYRGNLDYYMAILSFPSLLAEYRDLEHRWVIQDKVNLTRRQKERLYELLVENAKPENLTYKYSEFHDNCSTRVRDDLDAALGGMIKEAYYERPSELTLRHYVNAGMTAVWWGFMGTEMLMNDEIDAPLTSWGEMFLPIKLREHLRELPAYDDDGMAIPGTTLLSETQRLVDLPEPAPVPNPFSATTVVLGLPLGLVMLGVTRARASQQPLRRAATVGFGLVSVVYGLFSTLWGLLLPLNWTLSHYSHLKHNALIWLFWPVDLWFAVYGALILALGRLPSATDRIGRGAVWLAAAHLMALAVLVLGWATGLIKQNVLNSLASFGLMAALYYATVFWAGRDGER